MEQREQVLCAILDAGELLLTAGAEVARVEDTIRRMAQAYGFGRVDVLTITASMIVTAQAEDGAVLTQTRRILRRETDMRRIEAVNALSRRSAARRCCWRSCARGWKRSGPCGTICRGVSRWRIWLFPARSPCFSAVRCGMVWRRCCAAWCCTRSGAWGARIALQPLVLTMLSAAAMCLAAVITVEAGLGQALDKIIIETLCC